MALGLEAIRLGDTQKAEEHLTQAAAPDRTNPLVWIALARLQPAAISPPPKPPSPAPPAPQKPAPNNAQMISTLNAINRSC